MRVNNSVKIIASFCLILATLFLFISPSVLFSKAERYYYQKVNPSAGIIHYEKLYKAQLDEAYRIMDESNKIGDTISKKNRVSITAKETQKFIATQKTKMDELFTKREALLNAIIATDDLGYGISLPVAQKEFYKKRKEVDINELKAFQVFKLANKTLIEGNNVYQNFWNYFYDITGAIAKEKDMTKLNTLIIKKEDELTRYYTTEVKKAEDNKLLSPAVFEKMNQGYELMQRIGLYYQAYIKDPNSEDTKDKETYLKQGFLQGENNNDAIYQEWMDKYVAPGMYLQNKMHSVSFNLWGLAYIYAKGQNMKGIFTVWNNNYPGYTAPVSNKPVETLANSQKQRDGYYQLYDKPYIKSIRTILNVYLSGDSDNTIPAETKTKKTDDKYTYGLDSFDKSYYKSKYVVILIDDYISGGNLVTIAFQDKPDRLFTAWIYELADKNFELRGFWSLTKQNEADITKINTEMKEFLMDKVHSL